MVKYNIIKSVFEKCLTLSEIRNKLNDLSQSEKEMLLYDNLNDAQIDYYYWLLHDQENLSELIEEHENEDKEGYPKGMIESLLREFKKQQQENKDKIFQLERKIFEPQNRKEKTPPVVDLDSYHEDYDYVKEDSLNVKYGELEQLMINNQANVDFTKENISSLQSYYSDGYQLLNSKLNKGRKWRGLSDSEKKYRTSSLDEMESNLSDAIKRTEGLPYPAKLYHRGEFDVSKNVGDHITFKGFTSTSFQKHVATDWTLTYSDDRVKYTYELLVDTGTKGVCANDRSKGILSNMKYEHELLLDKGLEGDIVNIDVKNHIVTLRVS